MIARHRTPTVFSIYMVDVLCCALGCVVLLWQVYHFEAEENASAASAALAKLNDARVSLNSLSSDVDQLKVALQASKSREVQVTLQLDDARSQLDKDRKLALVYKQDFDDAKKAEAVARAMIAQLQTSLIDWQKKSQVLTGDLEEQKKSKADLLKQLASALAQLQSLEKNLVAKNADLLAAEKKWRDQEKETQLAMNRSFLLEKDLGALKVESKANVAQMSALDLRSRTLEQELARLKKDLEAAGLKVQDLATNKDLLSQKLTLSVKDLEDARTLLASLKGDNLNLLRLAQKYQLDSLNRFAGITLTGQKVVFLIDISGSMELIEGTTPDPDKWPTVCEAIAKLMRSLPDLKEYQVILFSNKHRYLFGNERRWLNYSSELSPKQVLDALKATKPTGATNLFDGFQEAFSFRSQGLDAIYLISDGLPTEGEGIPAGANLNDSQRTEILSRHLRQRIKNDWNRPQPGQPRVRINAIGFFYDSPDVGAFLWALAREHDGGFVGMSKP